MAIIERHNAIGVTPSSLYIRNRFDQFSDDYYSFELFDSNGRAFSILGMTEGSLFLLGIAYVEIEPIYVQQLVKHIFAHHKSVKMIRFESMSAKMGIYKRFISYRIELPKTEDELHKRLSSHGYSDIKRRKRKASDFFGSVKFDEYDIGDITDIIVQKYFEFKYDSYHVDYKLEAQEYLKRYAVTNAYVMSAGDEVLAIIFSCEQFQEVFPENLAFNPNYPHFSCGQVLYDWYLTRLIFKGKTTLYLGGGDYLYKKRYGSITDEMYSCMVFRNSYQMVKYGTKRVIRKLQGYLSKELTYE